jgi:hypothetical protein
LQIKAQPPQGIATVIADGALEKTATAPYY